LNWPLVLLYIVVFLAFVSLILYFFQDYFLFRPEKLPQDFEFNYKNQEVEEYYLEIKKGVKLNGLHFKSKRSKGLVFYLKGNSKSIKGWGKFALDFTSQGWDVFMMDYRGFGKSTGKRSQESFKIDVQLVYDKLKEVVNEKHIIIYGRSFGTGLATKLASVNNPRMLILACPYYSMRSSIKRFFPVLPVKMFLRFSMPTYKWIKYVKCPIHIIHGTKDKQILFKSGIKLSQINAERTHLYPVINGGHKNLHNFKDYHTALKNILNSKLDEKLDRDSCSIDFVRSKNIKIKK